MLKFLIFLFCPIVVFAGYTSQWSDTFFLKDPTVPTQAKTRVVDKSKQFDIMVQPMHYSAGLMVRVSGIDRAQARSLRIYSLNGRLLADLSSKLHAEFTSILWKEPAVSSGLIILRLSNGNNTKTIKHLLLK